MYLLACRTAPVYVEAPMGTNKELVASRHYGTHSVGAEILTDLLILRTRCLSLRRQRCDNSDLSGRGDEGRL